MSRTFIEVTSKVAVPPGENGFLPFKVPAGVRILDAIAGEGGEAVAVRLGNAQASVDEIDQLGDVAEGSIVMLIARNVTESPAVILGAFCVEPRDTAPAITPPVTPPVEVLTPMGIPVPTGPRGTRTEPRVVHGVLGGKGQIAQDGPLPHGGLVSSAAPPGTRQEPRVVRGVGVKTMTRGNRTVRQGEPVRQARAGSPSNRQSALRSGGGDAALIAAAPMRAGGDAALIAAASSRAGGDAALIEETRGTVVHEVLADSRLDMVLPSGAERGVVLLTGHAMGLLRLVRDNVRLHHMYGPSIVRAAFEAMRLEGAVGYGINEVVVLFTDEQIRAVVGIIQRGRAPLTDDERGPIVRALEGALERSSRRNPNGQTVQTSMPLAASG